MPATPTQETPHEVHDVQPIAVHASSQPASDTASPMEQVRHVEEQMRPVGKHTEPSRAHTEVDDALPDFALEYAPYVYLDQNEKYFPGLPNAHVTYTMPHTFGGEAVDVPEEHKGKLSMLTLLEVNRPDVFLTMRDVREAGGQAAELKNVAGKPDEHGKSEAPVWIVVRNKTGLCEGEGEVVDVFYFFFYPYNLGNTVVFKHFGNHVGDWEHAMIRFRNGKPEAMHLSAHSDGNAWRWSAFEKKGERPIIYSAAGSHAMYPTKGTHDYSGVFLVGPSDHTSTGYLWDPTLNFVVARSQDTSTDTSAGGPCSRYSYMISHAPGFNTSFTAEDVSATLSYQGRWGNSFSDLRQRGGKTALALNTISGMAAKPTTMINSLLHKVSPKRSVETKPIEEDDHALHAAEEAVINGEGPKMAAELHKETDKKGKSVQMVSPYTRLLVLIWAEGPTGPRDKSLERRGMNRWKEGVLEKF